MLSYCLECRKNAESKAPNIAKTEKGKPVLLSNCSVYNSKKSRFIKEQEAKGLLCMISKILLIGPLLI